MAKQGVNKVILVGNLGNDPEVKYTQGGMCVTKISLATTSVRNGPDGNKQERTEWHQIKLFGKLGEIAGEYLKKGRQVYIEGEIRYDSFTGQDGVKKYYTEIVADEMQMLGNGNREDSGSDNRGSGSGYSNRSAGNQQQGESQQQGSQSQGDDDPF